MSIFNNFFDLHEQICYVQCGFCTTILLVNVPCSSMSMVVTVKCGHCTKVLSVNMLKASFFPFHLFASISEDQYQKKEFGPEKMDARNSIEIHAAFDTYETNEEYEKEEDDDDLSTVKNMVNKPPEKRQRAPTAYNRFIKEEIKRLKAENPKMAHKEAFSTAAKNWAQFPPNHYREDGDGSDQAEENYGAQLECNVEGKGFQEKKVPRHSISAESDCES